MQLNHFFLAVIALSGASCGTFDDPFDTVNHEMVPLKGVGERPTIRNRFPESRGGLPLSRSDREDHEMTPVERLKQYEKSAVR